MRISVHQEWQKAKQSKARQKAAAWAVLLYCCCRCCSVSSVLSDSVRPHRRQPTRLPVPGILQARTRGWGATSFSNAVYWVSGKGQECPGDPWEPQVTAGARLSSEAVGGAVGSRGRRSARRRSLSGVGSWPEDLLRAVFGGRAGLVSPLRAG